MTGLKRNISKKVEALLHSFPAVIIIGTRQCGKTTLSKQLRPEWKYFDIEKQSDRELITNDYDFFFSENKQHIIIDEAQADPQIFNEIRGVIDNDRQKKNRFILTGSSSFELIKNVSESLPGRAAIIELGTLKANEIQERPLSQFYTIFESKISEESIAQLKQLKSNNTYKSIEPIYLQGGYPEPALSDEKNFYDAWMTQYYQTYIERDIRKLFPKLNHIKFARFIKMLSSLSGTLINKSELGRSLDTSEVTIRDYLDIAHNTFIWRNITPYEKSKSKSLIKMPKGIFRDSGLNHFLKRIKTSEDLIHHPTVGIDFEAFVIEEIIKGLEATLFSNWTYHYYRTKNGAEIDLILEGDFGIVPIEIKYGKQTKPQQLKGLQQFINTNNIPLGMVINNSDDVRMLSSNIIQIPIGLI